MDLIVVGLNHRTAPLEVRERVTFDEREVQAALARARSEQVLAEAMSPRMYISAAPLSVERP